MTFYHLDIVFIDHRNVPGSTENIVDVTYERGTRFICKRAKFNPSKTEKECVLETIKGVLNNDERGIEHREKAEDFEW